jgi:hypothetical protein
MSENMVEISENSLAILLSETEAAYRSLDDFPDGERERLEKAMKEARNTLK